MNISWALGHNVQAYGLLPASLASETVILCFFCPVNQGAINLVLL